MSSTGSRLIAAIGLGAVAVTSIATTATAITATTDLSDPTVLTAGQLAQQLVGPGVAVSNVSYTGAPVASGTFSGGETSVGIASGVALTSGDLKNTVGPNTLTGATRVNGGAGDADLTTLASQTTNDASILSFDFTANADTVYFQYVFSSEEYLEFVGQYNDVFAFWVNGVNCAVVPDPADPTQTAPVSVNTINTTLNPSLYVNNTTAAFNTQMDGFTVPLTCMSAVNPAPATNTMKLAIADSGDSSLDSAVLLAEGSLSTTPPEGTAKVTGGGRLDLADGKVTLGTNAIRDDAGLHGNLQVNDHRTGDKFHGDMVTSLTVTDKTAVWAGTGRFNGQEGYTFETTVVDNRNGNSAKKGSPDTVAIVITDGTGATVWALTTTDLTRGNMTVHDTE